MKTYPRLKTTLPSGRRADILDFVRPFGTLMLTTVLFVTPVSADTAVLTLDEHTIPAALQCGETWNEAGLDMAIVPHPAACFVQELCVFTTNPDHLTLSPAILDVDLTGIPGTVTSAMVFAGSPCGNCVKVVLYDVTTVVDSAVGGSFPVDTLAVFTPGMPVDRLVIEGCYSSAVHDIRVEFDPTTTDVGPPDHPLAVPLESWPIPFRATTRISFDLHAGARVQLRIYDVLGRAVRSLVDADLPAGRRTAAWDSRDTSGRRLATGTYFARLVVNGRIAASRKVVIAK